LHWFPVCRGNRSDLVGIVLAGDVFEQAIFRRSMPSVDIEKAVKPALYFRYQSRSAAWTR
jgi:putative hemolysin